MTKDGKLGWGVKRFGHVATHLEAALSSAACAAERAPLPAPETPSRRTQFSKSFSRLFTSIHQVTLLGPGWRGLGKGTKPEQFSAPYLVSSSEGFFGQQAEKLGNSRRPVPFY